MLAARTSYTGKEMCFHVSIKISLSRGFHIMQKIDLNRVSLNYTNFHPFSLWQKKITEKLTEIKATKKK